MDHSEGGAFKVDHKVIEGAIETIKKQTDLIDKEVTKPLTVLFNLDVRHSEVTWPGEVPEKLSGIWRGEAAKKFWVDMHKNVILPLGKISKVHNDFGSLLTQALEMFSKAEEQALPVAEACLRVAKDLSVETASGSGGDLDRDFNRLT